MLHLLVTVKRFANTFAFFCYFFSLQHFWMDWQKFWQFWRIEKVRQLFQRVKQKLFQIEGKQCFKVGHAAMRRNCISRVETLFRKFQGAFIWWNDFWLSLSYTQKNKNIISRSVCFLTFYPYINKLNLFLLRNFERSVGILLYPRKKWKKCK